MALDNMEQSLLFLSTPSARRATKRSCPPGCRSCISIHALREEGDQVTLSTPSLAKQFLSTPSARRATKIRGED